MSARTFFDDGFQALTGKSPLGWQRRLFEEHFVHSDVPPALDIPTGLGKTSVIVIWLLALAWQSRNNNVRLPRRLAYVVNRRTVVDQATDIAEALRSSLKSASADTPAAQVRDALAQLCLDPTDDASPLAISTLRGELADNREWQADPARSGIIIGTVDMIGSRLLFSGYGVSRRMRPFHAGLLGQDTLLVHDEAHLSGPFGALLRYIAQRQLDQKAPRPVFLIELSATQRDQAANGKPFTLTAAEKAEPEVKKRLYASKRLCPPVDGLKDEDATIAKIVELALAYKDEHKRILVYVRRPSHANEIADRLTKVACGDRVQLLTGTIRGYERDKLADTALFQGFRTKDDREPPEETEYLVATSAGEVGVDLDADHLVCDLSTLDSMIQRLGRVNRLGGRTADIHVVEWPKKERKGGDELDRRITATKKALLSLTRRDGAHDASPESLRILASHTDAFAHAPRLVPVTDILIDNWSLTRVDHLPGRPLPERWLHGVEAGPPDLYVAWRTEVNEVVACVQRHEKKGLDALKRLYDKHPILARECLRGPLDEVQAELAKIAKRTTKEGEVAEPIKAVLLPATGDPVAGELSQLLEREDALLPNATLVLPPEAGGLDSRGMLAGAAPFARSLRYDVADISESEGSGRPADRGRVLLRWHAEDKRWAARWIDREGGDDLDAIVGEQPSLREAVSSVLEVASFVQKDLLVLDQEEDGEPTTVLLLLGMPRSADAAQENPAAASRVRLLDAHLADVHAMAKRSIQRIGPLSADKAEAERLAEAILLAARWHDLGKNRDPWQADIGNPRRKRDTPNWKPLAKSGRRGFVSNLSGAYRHEFGSMREASEDRTIREHSERDLILHLIAAHHGWARPHFRSDQWDIADGVSEEENAVVAAETMRRFARLQRRFGHWGLAWLEAIVRAADYAATERLSNHTVASGEGA